MKLTHVSLHIAEQDHKGTLTLSVGAIFQSYTPLPSSVSHRGDGTKIDDGRKDEFA